MSENKCIFWTKISTKITNRALPSSRGSVIWSQNYRAKTRLSVKSLSSVLIIKYRGGENERKFVEIHCGRVKNYLCERGTQLSNDSKGKKKENFSIYARKLQQ